MLYRRKRLKPADSRGPVSSLKMQEVDQHLEQELYVVYLQLDDQDLRSEHPETMMFDLGMPVWHVKPPFDSQSFTNNHSTF